MIDKKVPIKSDDWNIAENVILDKETKTCCNYHSGQRSGIYQRLIEGL